MLIKTHVTNIGQLNICKCDVFTDADQCDEIYVYGIDHFIENHRYSLTQVNWKVEKKNLSSST